MSRVAVFGASGMLGAMVLEQLAAAAPDFQLIATVRDEESRRQLAALYPAVELRRLDADEADAAALGRAIAGADWIISCIGLIKHHMRDDRPADVERALLVNGLFPHRLARAAAASGAQLLAIATDCVFSGRSGGYDERAAHDPLDVYGKSKSLGEVNAAHVHQLRCSIIGRERKSFVSLLEWFLSRPQNSEVNGYTHHRWNGVTTLHFARLAAGIIRQRLALPSLQHVVPAAVVSKAEMLASFARVYGRADLRLHEQAPGEPVDRSLTTLNQTLNHQLWAAAGYATPPTVEQMIEELAAQPYRFAKARP